MQPKLSIVITNRDEPMLPFTVRRIHETASVPVEVIVVDDGSRRPPEIDGAMTIPLYEPTGLAYARDLGIMAAQSDAVLILDAHMNFHDDDWADYCADYAMSYPAHIGCAVSVQLDSDPGATPSQQMDMGQRWNNGEPSPRAKYYGAKIETVCQKTGRPFPCKWHGQYRDLIEHGDFGEIQCILGGAYVLNRNWYVDTLKRPWQPNRGWGTSEQTIAMPNWLMGGKSTLLPIEIGHQYRTGRQDLVPYTVGENMEARILWNRYKLIRSLPLPADLEGKLLDRCLGTQPGTRIDAMLNNEATFDCAEYRAYLHDHGKRSWAEYAERWEMAVEI
jgi:glycosyltransferase involved in cell wall biosynthesis